MAYIAPPINQMSRQDLNDEDCVICFEQLYLPGIRGPPVEITTCHHRFHRDCLQTYCGNPVNRNNTLIACACPTCQRRFNFNIRLQDLTQQVTDRFAVLDAEDAAAALALAAGPVVPDAGPAAGLNPQLQNYLQNNYNIDRITKEFTNCFSQIIDDAVAFRNDDNMGLEFMRQQYGMRGHIDEATMTRIKGDPLRINAQKIVVIQFLVSTIHKIIQNYKFNSAYTTQFNDSLEVINIINNRLNDNVFIDSLYQLDTARNGMAFDVNSGLKTNNIPIRTYDFMFFLTSLYNGRYTANMNFPIFTIKLFEEIVMCFEYKLEAPQPDNGYYLNLVPYTVTNGGNVGLIAKPDYRFFIRYFECFVNFVRQLVAINFDVAQQLGGKRNKSRRVKKSRKVRRTRKHKK